MARDARPQPLTTNVEAVEHSNYDWRECPLRVDSRRWVALLNQVPKYLLFLTSDNVLFSRLDSSQTSNLDSVVSSSSPSLEARPRASINLERLQSGHEPPFMYPSICDRLRATWKPFAESVARQGPPQNAGDPPVEEHDCRAAFVISSIDARWRLACAPRSQPRCIQHRAKIAPANRSLLPPFGCHHGGDYDYERRI